ncbi:MAG: beta-propeller domain-containing protein [Pelotomaculum sp.]|jgi:inhibitor of cysteine peptidase
MRKLLPVASFILVLTIAVFLNQQHIAGALPNHTASFVVNQTTFSLDGEARGMDAAPFIEQGRTYIPLRYLAYALGITDDGIIWDGQKQKVTLSTPNGNVITVTVGKAVLTIDGQEQLMDVTPLLIGERVYLPVRWLAEALGYEVGWQEDTATVFVGSPGSIVNKATKTTILPAVGSYENLKDLLTHAQSYSGNYYKRALIDEAFQDLAPQLNTKAESLGSAADTTQAGTDYSKTNTQVAGVDEADIVKTDGIYIYQVNRERVVIAKAQPAEDMAVVSTLDFAGKDFTPLEMCVDEKHLVLIGTTRSPAIQPSYKLENKARIGIIPPYYQNETTRAIIYSVSDKSNPRKLRELELNGDYVSSRKIGSSFYLVANQHLYYSPGGEIDQPRPLYRDTALQDGFLTIDYPEIKCFPDFTRPGYLIVAGLNLDQPQQQANVSAYLGSGENVYASAGNLYVAVTGYQQLFREAQNLSLPWSNNNVTKIYKFNLNQGKINYAAQGEVPGQVLNQFSMDEHLGNFRIATTQGDMWRTDEYTSRNSVFILDDQLKITGRLENIAPGEKIYSARFIGDRGYLVTFKTVDPFFVLDLKDPQKPTILGALKMPGYSDYLHPYDANHVIGFGKDTIELSNAYSGDPNDTMAFYLGMKMAVFDVTDVNHPVVMFKETIGDRGTDSELLQNHKALLFDKEKNLLAFPVKVMVADDSQSSTGSNIPRYGNFAFQGAYIYSLDLTNGFSLKGKLTHLTDEDYLKAGNYWYNSDKNITRILYINDELYTLSNSMIMANSLNDLKEIKRLEIK